MLLLIVGLLAASTVLAQFVRDEVLDTNQYVETMAPLASSAVLQQELANRITVEIMNAAADALPSSTDQTTDKTWTDRLILPLVTRQAEPLVHRGMESMLASDTFRTLWTEANRQAHQAVVALLTGKTYAGVSVGEDGQVTLSLEPILAEIKDRLVDSGLDFAAEIPVVDTSFVLFQSPDLVQAQGFVSILDTTADVLPWVVLLLALAAIWVAPKNSRRTAFSLVGVSIISAMALLAVAIAVGRSVYLDAIPTDVLSPPAAAVLIDAFLDPLRARLWPVVAIAIAIALSGCLPWLIGVSRRYRRGMHSAPVRAAQSISTPPGGGNRFDLVHHDEATSPIPVAPQANTPTSG